MRFPWRKIKHTTFVLTGIKSFSFKRVFQLFGLFLLFAFLLFAVIIFWPLLPRKSLTKDEMTRVIESEIKSTLRLNWPVGFTNVHVESHKFRIRDDTDMYWQLLATDQSGFDKLLEMLDVAKIVHAEMNPMHESVTNYAEWWTPENYRHCESFMYSKEDNSNGVFLRALCAPTPTNHLIFLELRVLHK